MSYNYDNIILKEDGTLEITSDTEVINETVDLNKVKGIERVDSLMNLKPFNGSSNSLRTFKISKLILPKHIVYVGKDFFRQIDVKSVVWPDDCTFIVENTFEKTSIEELSNIDNVKIIGRGAFKDCTNLKEFTFPENVSQIPDGCFYGCLHLQKISVKGKICFIGEEAFCTCRRLNSLEFLNDINKIPKRCFFGCESLKKVVIPDNITFIDSEAFKFSGVSEIVWGKNVSTIPDECFGFCTLLKKITNVNDVVMIGTKAFMGSALEMISKMPNLKEIGEEAFSYTEIQEFNCSSTVSFIGKGAFKKCEKLKTFTWPASYTTLQAECFSGCCLLETINGMFLVSYIGEKAFYNCSNFICDFSNAFLTYVEKRAFDGTKKVIY